MRFNAQNEIRSSVWPQKNDPRSIRMNLGANRYSMTIEEALELARQLADAVEAARSC
jgi:hypothetical protein